MMQLPLSLTLKDESTFDKFVVGENEAVVANLKQSITDQDKTFYFLWGHSGVGKSHLLQASCASLAGLNDATTMYIALSAHTNYAPEMLQGLETVDLVCLDDIAAIAGHPAWEEAIFHLYNRLKENNKQLFITSVHPVTQCGIALADLKSRLIAMLAVEIKSLSDSDKIAALCQHAKERGITLSAEVAEFILMRSERSMTRLMAILDDLDKASLSAQRKLTIPFVKSALGMLSSRAQRGIS